MQYAPTEHTVVAVGAVEPAGQWAPGAAAQAPEQAALVSPAVAPYLPPGHCWQAAEPGADEKLPAGQGAQVSLEDAPVAALAVPAGQGVAATEEKGQKEPGGQNTGAPEAQ